VEKLNRDRLLALERRILEADERLVAAQNALEEAKRTGRDTPEMSKALTLMEESLNAMTTYRELLLNAIRSSAAADD
jgi:hypothetical protein